MTRDNDGSHEVRSPARETLQVRPAVDVYETDAAHMLLADLPGVRREGLDISVEHGRLTVLGRVRDDDNDRSSPDSGESPQRDYYRAFTLSDDVDVEKINATLTDGVLRLELPKSARARVRKVPVIH